jgi:hypothetical protein
MQILFFTDFVSPRLKYIVEHILRYMLGFDVLFTQNVDEFSTYSGPKICYSHNKAKNSINIKPHSLLLDNNKIKQSFAFFEWRSLPVFFLTDEEELVPFDIFAASFYLISRYEEYLPFVSDKHKRFPAEVSLAFNNSFLRIPLIDLWVMELKDVFKKFYENLKFNQTNFKYIPTIDVDNAYAYKHKGLFHSALAALNSIIKLNFKDIAHRLNVHLGYRRDPYDTYDNLFQIFNADDSVIWFVLGGKRNKFDRNIPLNNPRVKLLLRTISNKYHMGLHPSYASSINDELMQNEKNQLEGILGRNVKKSRQHFLRIEFPQTFRRLVSIGVEEDFSLGYPNHIGFRASTCTPFNFYDLDQEKELPLKIIPFQVMDRALLIETKGDALEAIRLTLNLAKEVKNVGGTFVSVWHNESLSGVNEWEGWDNVLHRINQALRT